MCKRYDGQFIEEDRHMAKKHKGRCSTLAIREMQVKTTIRYHYIPIRMAKIKNSDRGKGWWGCREIRSLTHCWQECKTKQYSYSENNMVVSYKTKRAITIWLHNWTTGHVFHEMKTYDHRKTYTQTFIAALFIKIGISPDVPEQVNG